MADALAAYAKIPGINGDSAEPHHIQWIEILSVDWSGKRGAGYDSGAARSSAVGTANEFKFTKRVDVASARLGATAAAGTHIPQVDVEFAKTVRTVSRSGAEVDSHLALVYRGVVIARIRRDATKSGEYPVETVTLKFGSVEFTYR